MTVLFSSHLAFVFCGTEFLFSSQQNLKEFRGPYTTPYSGVPNAK